jgi:hypothetical protein
MKRLYLRAKNDRGEKLWLNYHVYRNPSQRFGSGSTKALVAIKSRRCSSIQMENVDLAAAIARMPLRLSALPVL